MSKSLSLLLLSMLLAGCATSREALVPTPWGVVGVKSFHHAPDAAGTRSALAEEIDSHRRDGLVSSQTAANEATVAAR
jgi:hypothetical protein